jgi:hypothetical protein
MKVKHLRPIQMSDRTNEIRYDKHAHHTLPLSSTPTRSYLTSPDWKEPASGPRATASHERGGQELVGGARRPPAAVGLAARYPCRQVRLPPQPPAQLLPSHLGCWVCTLRPFYASASLRIGGRAGVGTPECCSVQRKFGILGGLGS